MIETAKCMIGNCSLAFRSNESKTKRFKAYYMSLEIMLSALIQLGFDLGEVIGFVKEIGFRLKYEDDDQNANFVDFL